MLKIVSRILIILLAAGIVCAGLYLVFNSAGASLVGLPNGDMPARPNFDAGAAPAGGDRPARPQFEGGEGFRNGDMPARSDGDFDHAGRGRGGEGGSLFAMTGILVNLGKVVAITALVILVRWGGLKLFRRRALVQAV